MRRRQWDFLTGDREKDQRNVAILLESVEGFYERQGEVELIRSAVDRALLVTGAECGILLLATEEGGVEPRMVRGRADAELPLDTPYSRSVVTRVWESGEASVTLDVADAEAIDMTKSIDAMQLLSVMGVPMPVQGRNAGVLYVHSTQAARAFTPSDLSLFQALGGLLALALENARLMAKHEEQQRMKRDLLVAQKIQQELMPEVLPQPAGFDLAGICRPCEETSGDYYDVIRVGEDRFALVVGDVSGHGLGPALVMASTRALLHATVAPLPDPVDVIRSVNDYLERDTPDDMFMSMFLGSLDPVGRVLRYVSAGHNPPFLLRPDGRLEELGNTGPALGIFAGVSHRVSEPIALEPGAVLMLYTDGLFEAHDPDDKLYGEDRLRASFQRHAQSASSAQAIVDGVYGDLLEFVRERVLDDDVTCLVVRSL